MKRKFKYYMTVQPVTIKHCMMQFTIKHKVYHRNKLNMRFTIEMVEKMLPIMVQLLF